MASRFGVTALLAGSAIALAGCQDDARLGNARAYQPIPYAAVSLMTEKGMTKGDPILVRSYKKEAELEIWKRNREGQYALLKTYPICRWSGQLGPKTKEGDRQAPEGFYAITPALMNPNSSFYLSFDTGFPNAYDRAHDYSGSFLMVHGACSSRGCFSMTDEQIAEIYAIGREAFAAGQRSFQFQSYPFRMTAENMAKHRNDPHIAFWRMLKDGSDHFEVTKQEPQVAVCGRRYVFNARPTNAGASLDPSSSCPSLTTEDSIAVAVAAKQRGDSAKVAEFVQKGTSAIKLVYEDGGQHPSFRRTSFASSSPGTVFAQGPTSERDVSRPEALERAPQEVEIDTNGKPKPVDRQAAKGATAVALAPLPQRAGPPSGRQPSDRTEASAVTASLPSGQRSNGTNRDDRGDDRPFFTKIITLGGLLSSDESAVQMQPAQRSDVPLPPRRQAGAGPANAGGVPARAQGATTDKQAVNSGREQSSSPFSWLTSLTR